VPDESRRRRRTIAQHRTAGGAKPRRRAQGQRFGWTFDPGDKVMQIENDYDKEVYNGGHRYIAMSPEGASLRPALTAVPLLTALVNRHAGAGLCRDDSQKPRLGVPRRRHPGGTQHYSHAAAESPLSPASPRQELVCGRQKKAVRIAVRSHLGTAAVVEAPRMAGRT